VPGELLYKETLVTAAGDAVSAGKCLHSLNTGILLLQSRGAGGRL